MINCLSKLYDIDNNNTFIIFLKNVLDKIPNLSKIDTQYFISKECPHLLANNDKIDNITQSNDDNHISKKGTKFIKNKVKRKNSKNKK